MATVAVSLPREEIRTTGYQVLLGAVIVQLILGTVYGYSVFWQPLESTVYAPVLTEAQYAALSPEQFETLTDAIIVPDAVAAGAEHDARQGRFKYAFAICILSFAGAMIFAGRLQDLKGPRFTAIVGGIVLASAFLIAGQMQKAITFYVCHALLMGAALAVFLLAFRALVRKLNLQAHPLVRYAPAAIVVGVAAAGVWLGARYVSSSVSSRLLLLWATIGLMAGVGIGYAYVCPIAALVKWFPAHKGLVSGIAVAGFGFGAYIFSNKTVLGAVGFIDAYGIERFFTVHALICFAAVCGGALLLRNPPVSASPSTEPRQSLGPAGPMNAALVESTWRQTLRSPRFYLVWLMFFSGAMAGLMVIGILKPFAGSQLVSAARAAGDAMGGALEKDLMLKGAAAVGWLAIFNALGRIVWGVVSDKIGRAPAMTAMFLLQAGMMIALSALETPWSLAVGAAWVGFNFGGNFALFPSLTADLFGAKNLGANYGWVFTAYGIAGVTGVALGNAAKMWSGSYFAAFAIAATLCVMSAALAWVLRATIRKAPA